MGFCKGTKREIDVVQCKITTETNGESFPEPTTSEWWSWLFQWLLNGYTVEWMTAFCRFPRFIQPSIPVPPPFAYLTKRAVN